MAPACCGPPACEGRRLDFGVAPAATRHPTRAFLEFVSARTSETRRLKARSCGGLDRSGATRRRLAGAATSPRNPGPGPAPQCLCADTRRSPQAIASHAKKHTAVHAALCVFPERRSHAIPYDIRQTRYCEHLLPHRRVSEVSVVSWDLRRIEIPQDRRNAEASDPASRPPLVVCWPTKQLAIRCRACTLHTTRVSKFFALWRKSRQHPQCSLQSATRARDPDRHCKAAERGSGGGQWPRARPGRAPREPAPYEPALWEPAPCFRRPRSSVPAALARLVERRLRRRLSRGAAVGGARSPA